MEAKREVNQGRRQPRERGKGTIRKPGPAVFQHNWKTPKEGNEARLELPSAKLALSKMDTAAYKEQRTVKWKWIFPEIGRQFRLHKPKRKIK